MVSAIAGRLHDLRLPDDSIVGIQLPKTVESVLTLLGVLRAGLIAAPLPLLWRHNDLVSRAWPCRSQGLDHLPACRRDRACRAGDACGGRYLSRPLCLRVRQRPAGRRGAASTIFMAEENPQPPDLYRAIAGDRSAHLALITWEATADSLVPVARNHAEIIAGGSAVLLEGRLRNRGDFPLRRAAFILRRRRRERAAVALRPAERWCCTNLSIRKRWRSSYAMAAMGRSCPGPWCRGWWMRDFLPPMCGRSWGCGARRSA